MSGPRASMLDELEALRNIVMLVLIADQTDLATDRVALRGAVQDYLENYGTVGKRIQLRKEGFSKASDREPER